MPIARKIITRDSRREFQKKEPIRGKTILQSEHMKGIPKVRASPKRKELSSTPQQVSPVSGPSGESGCPVTVLPSGRRDARKGDPAP
jgi:hypothetical protein